MVIFFLPCVFSPVVKLATYPDFHVTDVSVAISDAAFLSGVAVCLGNLVLVHRGFVNLGLRNRVLAEV